MPKFYPHHPAIVPELDKSLKIRQFHLFVLPVPSFAHFDMCRPAGGIKPYNLRKRLNGSGVEWHLRIRKSLYGKLI